MVASIRERSGRSGRGSPGGSAFRVIWLGDRPWWLDEPEARAEIGDIEPGQPAQGPPRPFVVHARASILPTLRYASHERLVADISGVARLSRAAALVARDAQVVLVDAPERLDLLRGGLSPAWSLLRTPLDLAAHAPERELRHRRDAELKRFRRLHRLGPRTILYAGPYTREGGLHVLLEIAEELQRHYDDLVVAAIPEGTVDTRYRDACERRALGLGHRAVIRWALEESERPLWYALATALCLPGTRTVDVAPALYAAAAGIPLVAVESEALAALPGALVPELAPQGDLRVFRDRLERLLERPAAARAAGLAPRRAAEAELSPAAAARSLRRLWSGIATVE